MLQGIDVATGQMFRDIGMPEVAEYDPWPLPDLEHSRAAGLLWVIPGDAGEAAGGRATAWTGGRGCACAATSLTRDHEPPRRGLGPASPSPAFQKGRSYDLLASSARVPEVQP